MSLGKRLASFGKACGEHKVIAGLLTAGLLSFIGYLFGSWANVVPPIATAIKTACLAIWHGVAYSVSVPVPVSLLVLFAAIAAWFALRAVAQNLATVDKVTTPDGPNIYSYREDMFQGVVWAWRYANVDMLIVDIVPHCPDDYTELILIPYHSIVFLKCETCGNTWPTQIPFNNYSAEGLRGVIKRQIRRKLDTGEWKDVVESYKPIDPAKPK